MTADKHTNGNLKNKFNKWFVKYGYQINEKQSFYDIKIEFILSFFENLLTSALYCAKMYDKFNNVKGYDEEWSRRKTAKRADGRCESACYISLSSHFRAGNLKQNVCREPRVCYVSA